MKNIKDLYDLKSKHSDYQKIPNFIASQLGIEIEPSWSKGDEIRYDYITKAIDFKDKEIYDIGGNVGYFAFMLNHYNNCTAKVVELNRDHVDFVNTIINELDLNNISSTCMGYSNQFVENTNKMDVMLNFNVLHHFGDDFGDITNIDELKTFIKSNLDLVSYKADYLVLQIGFNWKGDITLPIFKGGTKKEMIDFVRESTKDAWDIISIGIAEQVDGNLLYKDLNGTNIERNDKLGEFFNRPLFIMRSRNYQEH